MGFFGHSATISHEDSRINALQIQQSTYGGVIPVIFGTNRIAGNLLDYIDFTAIPHTTTTHSGGKGGGGVTSKETTYTYTVAAIIGVGEGPISGISKIWKEKETGTASSYGFSVFTGDNAQQPWGYMLSKHPERALYYPKTAYIASPAFDLGSNAELPNFNFEVKGRNLFNGSLDANPADIIKAILSDLQIGSGFPVEYIGDFNMFSNYCIANGVLFSPTYTSQDEAQQVITNLCQAANAEPVNSQGKLKIVPYGMESITANGVTYTPPECPYEIGPDDFVYEEGEPPVKIKPNLTADRYNIQPVEIANRANDYNVEPIKATDDPDINDRGPRMADSIEMHFITTPEVGQFAAQSVLQRQLYVLKQYEFTLTWRHCLLDPMDVIRLTEPDFLGLDHVPVRIIDIEEADNLTLRFTAEDCPEGVHSPALYSTQTATRPALNSSADPGNTNAPIIFDPPPQLTGGNLTAWLAVSGQSKDWGGCGVWVSQDGSTYKRIGTITAPNRTGSLSAALPAGSSPDTANILSVDLTQSNGQLLSGTKEDADTYNTLCYVDGELISYQNATLSAVNKYNLSYLVRGIYGTPITAHNQGGKFARLNDIFKYSYSDINIGQTIYIKLTSFNVFGNAEQSLDEVQAYQHTLTNNGKGSSNASYTFTQSTASTTWAITHNLNKYPSVSCVDSSGNLITGSVSYTSFNGLTITFSKALSGSAYLT